MVASIFLASKVENEILKAESISLATKDQNKEVTVNQIVQHELLLLRGIGFQVSVHVCVCVCVCACACTRVCALCLHQYVSSCACVCMYV